jgi:hypothetical protein
MHLLKDVEDAKCTAIPHETHTQGFLKLQCETVPKDATGNKSEDPA